MNLSSLLSLPSLAMQAVVDALRCQPTESDKGGALHGLRGTCRQLRVEANARTRRVSTLLRCRRQHAFGFHVN